MDDAVMGLLVLGLGVLVFGVMVSTTVLVLATLQLRALFRRRVRHVVYVGKARTNEVEVLGTYRYQWQAELATAWWNVTGPAFPAYAYFHEVAVDGVPTATVVSSTP